jgi:hypothetical protein
MNETLLNHRFKRFGAAFLATSPSVNLNKEANIPPFLAIVPVVLGVAAGRCRHSTSVFETCRGAAADCPVHHSVFVQDLGQNDFNGQPTNNFVSFFLPLCAESSSG